MKSALLVVVVVCVFAGIAVADDEFEFFEGGPPYPGGGDHPPEWATIRWGWVAMRLCGASGERTRRCKLGSVPSRTTRRGF
jgi:hypothetical protein